MIKEITIPSVVDCHVHLRVPGGEHKEDFSTGSRAALAGGVSTLLAMPNTNPPIVDEDIFLHVHNRANQEGTCTIKHFVGATQHNVDISRESPPIAELAAGLKIYVNDTFGDLKIADEQCIREHLLSWNGRGPVAVHAEEDWVELLCRLAKECKQHVHFCHISRAQEISYIAKAKAAGISVSCEVAPHHLFLTENDKERLGPFAHVAPPLNSEQDRQALWEHLEIIDCIATDHAPHTIDEKNSGSPPPGLPGLEALLPLMGTAVYEEQISLEKFFKLISENPRNIYSLTDPVITSSKTIMEIGTPYTLPEHEWQTRSAWSPFSGKTVYARVKQTYVGDTCVYKDGIFTTDKWHKNKSHSKEK